MNAPAAIPLEDRFGPATETIDAWRGRCLAQFGSVELAVSEALAALGESGTIPLLVGQRTAALIERLEGRADATSALKALRAFATRDELRAFLCHAERRITLDRGGAWLATFTLLRPCAGKLERRSLLLDAEEALLIARALERDRQRLVAHLTRLTPAAARDEATLRIVARTG